MKRYPEWLRTILCACFFCTAVLCLNPFAASASPPSDIVLQYNSNTQTLSVTITHQTSSPTFHFIKYVEITKNGNMISSNTYESQPDKLTFTYTYKIVAVEGETFEVTGRCSIWGTKTVSYTPGKPVAANMDPAKK